MSIGSRSGANPVASWRRMFLMLAAACPIFVAGFCVLALTLMGLVYRIDAPGWPEWLIQAALPVVGLAATILLVATIARPGTGRGSLDRLSVAALTLVAVLYGTLDSVLGRFWGIDLPAVILAMGLVAAWPLFLPRGRSIGLRRLMGLVAVVGAFLGWWAAVPRTDWDPRKPFTRAYFQIHRGMSLEEVRAILGRDFLGRRPVMHQAYGNHIFTLDPRDRRYNSERIFVRLGPDGQVLSAEYAPDD